MSNAFTTYFKIKTPLGHFCEYNLERWMHIKNNKTALELPSVFEIKDSVTNPCKIIKSEKKPTSYHCILPVGDLKGVPWFTSVVVDTEKQHVSTAYNTPSDREGKILYEK